MLFDVLKFASRLFLTGIGRGPKSILTMEVTFGATIEINEVGLPEVSNVPWKS
jgi:hypothetical protein